MRQLNFYNKMERFHFCSALSPEQPESWHWTEFDLYFCQHAVSLSVDTIFFCVSNVEKMRNEQKGCHNDEDMEDLSTG